jgi:hypothetical protein
MLDNDRNTAVTLAIGRSGNETAIRGSFGFEFGAKRPIKLDIASLVPPAPPPPDPKPIVDEAVHKEREQIEEYHDEDMLAVQLQQQDLIERLDALEKKANQPPRIVQAPAPKPEPAFTEEQKRAAWAALKGEDE